MLPPDRVSADDKLLSSVDAHLLPRAGTLARLITTATALRHQAFQIPWTDGDQRATAAGRQLFSMGFLTTCNFARRIATQGKNLHEHSGENVHLRRDLPCPINVFFFPIPSDMRRFFHSVIRHIFLIVILVIVTLWPRLNDWIRWILQQFLDSQATQGMFRSVAEILVARPQLIPPVIAGSWLQDRLYIARVTLRGGGIHQTMWFAIYNFQVTDEQPNSIFGPLGLIERVRLRLHLLGLLRAWKPY